MAPKLTRWMGWTLIFVVIALPGFILASHIERGSGWSGFWPDVLCKIPPAILASLIASLAFPLQPRRNAK